MTHRDGPQRWRRLPLRRFAPYLLGVVVLGLVVALLLAGPNLGGHSAGNGAAPPVLPTITSAAPVPGPATAGTPSRPATASPVPSRSVSAKPSVAVPALSTPSASPTPTLPPAPTRAANGRFVGPGGLCLDDNGAISAEHNKIQMWGCNTTSAQIWTIATDGTFQVVGRCLRITDSGAAGSRVELFSCDPGAAVQQWRLLPSAAIVNPASGLCLTNPGASQTSGAQVVVQSCATPLTAVGTDQQWHFTA